MGMGQGGAAIIGMDSSRVLHPINQNEGRDRSPVNFQDAMNKELDNFLRSDANDLKRMN